MKYNRFDINMTYYISKRAEGSNDVKILHILYALHCIQLLLLMNLLTLCLVCVCVYI